MNDTQRDEQLWALLPWYINGTLQGEELRDVEALIQRSEEAAREAELLRKLQAAIGTEELVTAPTELSWRRFQQSLPDKEAATKVTFPWLKLASVAAVMIIAVQSALLVYLPKPVDVELLGGDESVQHQVDAFYVKVMFSDQASWKGIEVLLASIEGEVVAGPSALGMVAVRIPKSDEQAKLLRQLEASPIVEHVQVVPDD